MAKVSINAEDASAAFFNVNDVIEALQRFDGVLQAPLSNDDDEDGYLIGDCLEDIKMFLQQLDEECHRKSRR
jgi:hypothetical protein